MCVLLTLPRSFDALEFLRTPRLQMKADEARWLVSTIVRKTAYRHTDTYGCVRLHWDILRRVLDKHTLAEVIRALVRGGAVETAPPCRGARATGYRLAKRYLSDRHVRVPVTDPRLIERIRRERRRQQDRERHQRWKPIHFALDALQRGVTITDEADLLLDRLPEHTRLCQDVLVSNIRRREYPFSVSSTGRVFNAVTGLKRELRQALRLDGQPAVGTDIRCAQPALLALLIHIKSPSSGVKPWDTYKYTLPGGPSLCCCPLPVPLPSPLCSPGLIGADFARFCECACGGSLYDVLARETGLERNSVKRRLLVDVLAKRGRYQGRVECRFRELFPSVYRFVRSINRRDHGALIRLLQRMESWLVIECVSARLCGAVRFLTLHDAVYASHEDLPRVRDAFEETFKELGFRLALKTE